MTRFVRRETLVIQVIMGGISDLEFSIEIVDLDRSSL